MTAGWWRIAALTLLLTSGGVREATACSCMPIGPPCQAAWDVDAIFAGTVRSIDVRVDETAGSTRVLETVVQFDVDQPLLHAVRGRIEIVTHGLSTCEYRFTAGQAYLVYAWKREDGRFMTGICSRTRPLADAAEDLKFLTALPKAGTGARVYGRVNEWIHHPADDYAVDYGPLENVTVNVRGAGFSRDVFTDVDGRYEFAGIPIGTVSISVVTPFGFRTDAARTVEVKDLRACVAADFSVHAESAAHGIVVDELGRPVAGVSVEAVAEELAGYWPKAIHSSVKTDHHGRFSFDRLPPGSYVFGINITSGPNGPRSGPSTFFPGTTAAREAPVFDLKPGHKLDVGSIRVANR